MKKISMYLMSIVLMAFSWSALAGKGAGGQFRYFRSDINAYLISAKYSLSADLRLAPQSLSKAFFNGQVDLKELAQIISRFEVRLDETPKTRMNPHGYEDILMMDYRVKTNGEKYIVALEPLFDHVSQIIGDFDADMWFHKEIFKEDHVESYFRRLMLHEALHHFGYDEEESFELSQLEAGLSSISSWKIRNAQADSVYFWSVDYKNALMDLSFWGRNQRLDQNQAKIEVPVDENLTLIIDTSNRKRVAYLKNKKFQSLLRAKCKSTKTERGSVFCEFKKRMVNGRAKGTVSGERVDMYINNPVLGKEQYIDGVYKTTRALRLKYRYQNEKETVMKETNIPFFNRVKE